MANNAMATLLAAVEKAKVGNVAQDPNADKFWSCERDKAGNGYAVIRFLPASSDELSPFVKYYSHGFQGPAGKWFIENCPTTLGQECPACQSNGVLWNSGIESDKDIVRKRKRRASYVANILVISDSKHPENEGKVFMFKFGQKIFDKILGALQPQFEDEVSFNPFDALNGANFKLKIRQVEGYANFDKSEFEGVSEMFDGDKKAIKEIISQLHDIHQFIDPKSYKSFDDLQTKLNGVLGSGNSNNAERAHKSEDQNGDEDFIKETVQKPKATKVDEGNEDADLDYFRRLANEG